MLVEVLGTNYEIRQDDSLKDLGADGLCKCYSKEILYRNPKDMLCAEDPYDVKMERCREVIRHELVHAFFHEAGLIKYGQDEELVDWIAMQFPKLLTAIEKARVIV